MELIQNKHAASPAFLSHERVAVLVSASGQSLGRQFAKERLVKTCESPELLDVVLG